MLPPSDSSDSSDFKFWYIEASNFNGTDYFKSDQIDDLMKIANNDSKCMGFNSEGYLKFYIPPLDQLELQSNHEPIMTNKIMPNPGLYIHVDRHSSGPIQLLGKIPKIIHFIWLSMGKPFNIVHYLAVLSVKKHNPDYRIILHCDAIPKYSPYYDDLVEKNILETNLVTLIESLNGNEIFWVQNKADYLRLSVLYQYGGIYLDLDIMTLKNFDCFLQESFVIGYERANQSNVCNAVMMTAPESPFIQEWLQIYQSSWGEKYVPFWLGHSTLIPFQLSKKYQIMICDHKKFYPFLWTDLSILDKKDNGLDYSESYVVHLWDTEAKKTGKLPKGLSYFSENTNAFTRLFGQYLNNFKMSETIKYQCNDITIFDRGDFFFISQMDQTDNDIETCKGVPFDKLVQKCFDRPDCVGFNTNGFLKGNINGLNQLKRLDNLDELEGIYIHKQRYLDRIQGRSKVISKNIYTVKFIGNWTDRLDQLWKHMSKDSKGSWDNIRLTNSDRADFYVIVNYPNKEYFDPAKTVIFQMEPRRETQNGDYGIKSWGAWADPNPDRFLQVRSHKYYPNLSEWHLKHSYSDLIDNNIAKSKTISSIVSDKLLDTGHHLRADFLKYLEQKSIDVDIFGRCESFKFKNYRGTLPDYDKSDGLMPYRYTIACENNSEYNYFTEKIVDPILSECLCFYWGCPNLEEYFPDAFVRLELKDFEHDFKIIKKTISSNQYKNRLSAIKTAKEKILNNMHIFPVMSRIIQNYNTFDQYFDRIFIINLDRSKDRWLSLEKSLKECNISNYERFSATDANDQDIVDELLSNGWKIPLAHQDRVEQYKINLKAQLATKVSHYRAIQLAKSRGYKKVLIMEDDLILKPENIGKLGTILNDIKTPWGLLNLYGSHGELGEQIRPGVKIMKHMCSCACYAIDGSKYDYCLDKIFEYQNEPVDDIFNNHIHPTLNDCLAIYPWLILPILDNVSTITGDRNNQAKRIKTYCVNLERRGDRRKEMIPKLNAVGLSDTDFFQAVDGKKLTLTPELYRLFKNNDFGGRRGFIGCAMSHYRLWQKLCQDQEYDAYLVLEDDIEFSDNFSTEYPNILRDFQENYPNADLLWLGFTMYPEKLLLHYNIYRGQSKTHIDLFHRDRSIGSTFAYLIKKSGARKLLEYANRHGIRHGIDYFMIQYIKEMDLSYLETQPHLVRSDWFMNWNSSVDTDIQRDLDKIDFSQYNLDYRPLSTEHQRTCLYWENPTYEQMSVMQCYSRNIKNSIIVNSLDQVQDSDLLYIFGNTIIPFRFKTIYHDKKLPYLVEKTKIPISFKKSLKISDNALVFGYIGDGFDLEFVKSTISKIAGPDMYFLFMNIEKFTDSPYIKFLEKSTDKCRQRLIATCDAMLSARIDGEPTGYFIREFIEQGKPIIMYKHPMIYHEYQCGLEYQCRGELEKILKNIKKAPITRIKNFVDYDIAKHRFEQFINIEGFSYYEVNDYVFVSNADSDGFDIKQISGDISKKLNECSVMSEAVGVNSNGWVKHHIGPLIKIDNQVGRKGLYIKKQFFSLK